MLEADSAQPADLDEAEVPVEGHGGVATVGHDDRDHLTPARPFTGGQKGLEQVT